MFEFRTQRLKAGIFKSREKYLWERIQVDDANRQHLTEKHMLCNAIARANKSFWNTSSPRGRLPDHFPWLTVVLGSGCASESLATTDFRFIQAKTIANQLRNDGSLANGRPRSDVAQQFAEDLIDARLPGKHGEPLTNSGREPDIATARLVLSAALVTCIFQKALAATNKPVDPRGNDRAVLHPALFAEHGEIRTVFVSAFAENYAALPGDVPAAVRFVFDRIHTNLNTPGGGFVNRLDVQILTEFAWLAMTESDEVYFGWSDLLALLVRKDEDPPNPDAPHRYPPRPSLEIDSLGTLIRERYVKVTKKSWDARSEKGPVGSRQAFFDSVARVLRAQSRVRGTFKEAVTPPVASAFSSSFDLELEMSLVMSRDLPGFVVALPVYLTNKNTSTATLHWLGAVIRCDDSTDLQTILKPKEWIRLSRNRWDDQAKYANWPIVVRLAGCPLIELPELKDLPKLQSEEINPEVHSVKQAILLDEYWAMQQHSTEMFGVKTDVAEGLPDQLMNATVNGVKARFWLVMGVQMDDTAVRHRVASRLGSGRKGKVSECPDRTGLVVTSKIDPAAHEMMQWFGVDIVIGDCRSFQDDLDHYVLHLVEPDIDDASKLVEHNLPCPLVKP